jgi:hypothetical protein
MQAACSMGGKRRNFATSLSGAKAWPAIRLSSIGRRMGFAGRAEQGLPPAEAGTGERGPHHLPPVVVGGGFPPRKAPARLGFAS